MKKLSLDQELKRDKTTDLYYMVVWFLLAVVPFVFKEILQPGKIQQYVLRLLSIIFVITGMIFYHFYRVVKREQKLLEEIRWMSAKTISGK